MKTAVFTIASKNYFAQVKTLMSSLREHQPSWGRYVVLVDDCNEQERGLIADEGMYCLILARDLPIKDVEKMFFRYTILELNTAVKPWGFEKLFYDNRYDYDAVVYMDPDICVYGPMSEIDTYMKEEGTIVLTPHITRPLEDDKKPTELNIMQGGVYNLGFIAVSKGEQTPGYVKWWQNKLEYDCVVDLPRGLFVDQKWMDLVPSLFDHVVIFKHLGYNAAYWNLSTRTCKKQDGRFYFDNDPLVFFHFSGFDPTNLRPFSKHQDRFTIDTVGDVKELAEDYAKRVLNFNYKELRKLRYDYNYFNDETKIIDAMRAVYNKSDDLIEKGGCNPFADSDVFNTFIEAQNKNIILTEIMDEIWASREDLKAVFPSYKGGNNLAFAKWFVDSAKREYDLDEKYINPVKEKINAFISSCDTEKNVSPKAVKKKRFALLLLKIAFKIKPFLGRICPAGLKIKLKKVYVRFLQNTYDNHDHV